MNQRPGEREVKTAELTSRRSNGESNLHIKNETNEKPNTRAKARVLN